MWEDLKFQFQKGNMVVKLIFVNVAIHFAINLLFIPFFLMMGKSGVDVSGLYYGFIRDWFYLPSDLSKLVWRPWTVLTYMFLHSNIFHLFFNMLMLYWFGKIMNDLVANARVLPLYLLGGLAGGILFVASYNIFPVFASEKPPILGASASVMGIVLGAATLNPKGLFYVFLIGEIQLRYIALFLFLIDLVSIPDGNAGGRIAHIGGAIMGWYYIVALRKGLDLSRPVNRIIAFISRPFARKQPPIQNNTFKREPQPAYRSQPNQNINININRTTAKASAAEDINPIFRGYSRDFVQAYQHLSRQGCVDAILDKIRKVGYSNLSEEEKNFLDKMSKEDKM